MIYVKIKSTQKTGKLQRAADREIIRSTKKGKGKEKKKRKDNSIVKKVVRDVSSILSDDDYLDLLSKGAGWLGGAAWNAAKVVGPWALSAGVLALDRKANPMHPRADVPEDMRMCASVRSPSQLTDRPTLLRQVNFPRAAAGGSAAGGMGFASDVKLSDFESSSPVTTPHGMKGVMFSGRAYLFPLPTSATRGELLASIPLDLAVGLLASSRLRSQAQLYNRVKWAGFNLVYVPTCPVDTDGAIMILGASDPLRTIASFPAGEQRIVAATQYGSNSALSRTWEPLAFSVPLDDTLKYQNMFPVSGEDERFVSPGIVEVLCNASWSGVTPGYVMFEYEAFCMEPVPPPFEAGASPQVFTEFMHFCDNTELVIAGLGGTLVSTQSIAFVANAIPGAKSEGGGGFSLFDAGLPTVVVSGSKPETSKFLPGGLARLGFTATNFGPSGLVLACPLGRYQILATTYCTQNVNWDGIVGTAVSSGVTVSTGDTSTTFSSGEMHWSDIEVNCTVAGSLMSLSQVHAAVTDPAAFVGWTITGRRIDSLAARFPPWVESKLKSDPFYQKRAGRWIVDAAEEQALGEAAEAPVALTSAGTRLSAFQIEQMMRQFALTPSESLPKR